MQEARWAIPVGGKEERRPVERIRRRLVAAVVGGLLPVWAWAGDPAAGSGEILVHFYPSALVKTEQITLADVAEVAGDGAELASTCPVAAAPAPGQERVVTLSQVRSVLGERGANLAQWVFRGSTRCTVKRLAAPLAGPAQPQLLSQAAWLRTERMTVGVKIPEATKGSALRPAATAPAAGLGQANGHLGGGRPDPTTLAGAIDQHVRQRLANIRGEPVLRYTPVVAPLLGLSKPTYDFQISDESERLLGAVPLRITIVQDGRVKQVVPALVEVAVRMPVTVAARPINHKEIIKAADLRIETRILDQMDQIGLSDPAPLIGQRARRLVNEGEVLKVSDIEPVPLVSRNDLVTVWVRRGALEIKGTAKAMGKGGYGETIELKNEASGKTFLAVVTGEKTVQITGLNLGPVSVAALAAPSP